MKFFSWIFAVLFLILQACSPYQKTPVVKLGIDVLEEQGFEMLRGKHIGLLSNKSGTNSAGVPTWKVLKSAPDVDLRVIFAPVHGFDGKFMALETFYNDEIDDIPVYSVFASNSKPKSEWLKGLDAVVVDLQDIGIRYYNYWAYMVYMMAACFEQGIELIVLDRPNPLGGHYIGGPVMAPENTSIWGPVPDMPLFHGMTMGELAKYCQNVPNGIISHQQIATSVIHSGIEVSAETLRQGKLTIIPMEGWKRNMLWEDTNLNWEPPSPRIPSLQSAREYAFVSLAMLAAPGTGIDSCNFIRFEPDWDRNLQFHTFSSKYVIPQYIIKYIREQSEKFHASGFSLELNKKNRNAIDITIKDIRKTIPGLFGLVMFTLSQHHTRFYFYDEDNYQFFAAHVGDTELLEKLRQMENLSIPYFLEKWKKSTQAFIEAAKPYYLYD